MSNWNIYLFLFITRFQCGICKEVCSDKPHLANHMRGNHLFPCNECHKIFSTQDDHTHHENSHFVKRFLIGFIALMCRTDITKNKASKRAMSSSSQDRRIKKIKLILLKRSKLLHKHQQVKEFNRYDDSTENDDWVINSLTHSLLFVKVKIVFLHES